MANAKYQIIGAVIKQPKPFKAALITQLTSLSRQLCFKHLTALVEDGYLEKDGMYYCIVDRPGLIDSLTSLSETKGVELLTKQRAYTGEIAIINKHIENAVVIRNAKVKGYRKVVEFYQVGIDATIEDLKTLKRYLNSKQMDQKKALVLLENELGTERWPLVRDIFLEEGITEEQLDLEVNNLLEEMRKE